MKPTTDMDEVSNAMLFPYPNSAESAWVGKSNTDEENMCQAGQKGEEKSKRAALRPKEWYGSSSYCYFKTQAHHSCHVHADFSTSLCNIEH